MSSPYLLRALAEFFPGAGHGAHKAQPVSYAATVKPIPAEPAQPRRVGEGARNETFVTIDGIPNLFVDEGDCIVQFLPAFEEGARDTRFGTKILPELAPHWSAVGEHVLSLKDAIVAAIRTRASRPEVRGRQDESLPVQPVAYETGEAQKGPAEPQRQATRKSAGHGGDLLVATVGRVVSWGEEKFPNRRPTGKPFYQSFAMHIATAMGEQVLQGEGLKDAIAESGCQVGDVVSVRRLEKIKVPAFTDGGRPIMKNGEQVLWDKWLWSITR